MPDILNTRFFRDLERAFFRYFYNWQTLIELLIILVLLFVSRLAAKATVKWLTLYFARRHKKLIKTAFDISIFEFFFIFFYLASLWAAWTIAEYIGYTVPWLTLATWLFTSWVGIRIITGIIESSFISRAIAVVIWAIAALYITSLLEPTMKWLGSYKFEMGTFKITLLTIAQGVVLFFVLSLIISFITRIVETQLRRSRTLSRRQKVLYQKVIRIVLIGFAVLFGLSLVGIDVTAIALLGSAVGFGIAFGLQKVFSNLISGLILLLDKSIQPGDVIAIGEDVYGEVKNLEARYVSVVTRDGKKHLIPNEILIAERVENWTFKDNRLRVRITIGVDYGSDLRLVQKLMIEAANEHPRMLQDPEPNCVLKDFRDSDVLFELRAWINDPVKGLGVVRSDIMFTIWQKFKENNIHIPYPKRDVNIYKMTASDSIN